MLPVLLSETNKKDTHQKYSEHHKPAKKKKNKETSQKELPSINAHSRFPCGRHVVYLKMERL